MRHLRIPGQNIKNLTAFKNQIGGILRELNKFDEGEKNEALTYLRSCISEPGASSSSTVIKQKSSKRKKLKLASEHVKDYNKSLRKKITSKESKNKTNVCEKTKIRKYSHNSNVTVKKIIFKCKVCSATEKTKKNMLKHLETHVGTPVTCLKCKRTFNGNVSFNWHLIHYCKPRFYEKWKFQCNQCPRMFMSKRTLDGHLQGHKRNNCTYCDKVLTRRIHLIRHLLEVHSIKLERDTYRCDHCEKRYIKKCSLYYHLRQHVPDKFVCLECGKIADSIEEYEDHKRHHDFQKHFTCQKCDEKFSRRQQYLYHLKRHDRYKCITCNETYASRAKVVRHKQQGHQVEGMNPNFICPHCPLAFHRENKLFIHMRKHTENNRNINCKYCKKTFSSPYAYYKHCITISHEKFSPEISDIVCENCGKHFVKKHDLKQHIYKVHNPSKEPFKCEHCTYQTFSKCNMERHVALHFRKSNQFTCEHCGRSCDSLASLKDHISYNHIQEKQFECEKCGKSFKRNSELVRHRNTHSDERPHICKTCGKSYKRLNHLKRHEQTAHKIVKESRRIKKIDTEEEVEVEVPCGKSKNELQSTSKIVILQQYSFKNENGENKFAAQKNDENIFMNFPEGNEINSTVNIVEQLVSSFLPEKDWGIENEDLYNVYNDVGLNYGNQQLSETGDNEMITNENLTSS